MRILDVARNMIRLCGFEPDVDIPIQVTGIRPGEKMTEELTAAGEEALPTALPKIRKIVARAGAPLEAGALGGPLPDLIARLEECLSRGDVEALRETVGVACASPVA